MNAHRPTASQENARSKGISTTDVDNRMDNRAKSHHSSLE